MLSFLRYNKMRGVAGELDMTYYNYVPYGEFTFLEVFELFQRSKRQKIRNVLSGYVGHHEVNVDLFDYGHLYKGEYKWQTVVLIRGQKLDLPQFIMRPQQLADKFRELFSHADINFDLYPRFSRNYYVSGPDETGIRYLMREPFLEYFNARPNWSLEGLNDTFILYRRRKRFKPSEMPGLYKFALETYILMLDGAQSGGYL